MWGEEHLHVKSLALSWVASSSELAFLVTKIRTLPAATQQNPGYSTDCNTSCRKATQHNPWQSSLPSIPSTHTHTHHTHTHTWHTHTPDTTHTHTHTPHTHTHTTHTHTGMHAHMHTLSTILNSHIQMQLPWTKKKKREKKKKRDREKKGTSQCFAFVIYSLWKLNNLTPYLTRCCST